MVRKIRCDALSRFPRCPAPRLVPHSESESIENIVRSTSRMRLQGFELRGMSHSTPIVRSGPTDVVRFYVCLFVFFCLASVSGGLEWSLDRSRLRWENFPRAKILFTDFALFRVQAMEIQGLDRCRFPVYRSLRLVTEIKIGWGFFFNNGHLEKIHDVCSSSKVCDKNKIANRLVIRLEHFLFTNPLWSLCVTFFVHHRHSAIGQSVFTSGIPPLSCGNSSRFHPWLELDWTGIYRVEPCFDLLPLSSRKRPSRKERPPLECSESSRPFFSAAEAEIRVELADSGIRRTLGRTFPIVSCPVSPFRCFFLWIMVGRYSVVRAEDHLAGKNGGRLLFELE